MDRFIFNFHIALEAIKSNKLRSFLTALGIIFGVSAVISMMAIGAGAQQEILNQMKLVGVNNIIVTPIVKQKDQKVAEEQAESNDRFSPGLNLQDLNNITQTLSNIKKISGEVVLNSYMIHNGRRKSIKLIGVNNPYFKMFNFDFMAGNAFVNKQERKGFPVCIIGEQTVKRFFNNQPPIGKTIKCGQQWLTVVGVLKDRGFVTEESKDLGIRNSSLDIYIPLQTMLIRYMNRGMVTKQSILIANRKNEIEKRTDGTGKAKEVENQLDRIVVQVSQTEELGATAKIIHRILKRRHNDNVDFEIKVPELLLKQQQKTKEIFNMVLGAIAGISLLVGGIGIMNIMLASVMERIKEIGLRIALGAQKRDIIQQFLFEAMLISLVGGIIGITLGVLGSFIISKFADIETVISFASIVTSFGVSSFIGIVFGITPAKKAANQNPITSLRHE
ncbi:ABC transporter permease [Halosquirtibacter laminarini]|uniref:ABC transporter permease n=1 Tax=Halosquirtibacter laminarini TaxID=3374600 RepID=A0AC61NEU9_9BACT|nr:ABC transporter permease [Prolixibacteraceae bacterium]